MVDKNILIYQRKIGSTIESIAEEIKHIANSVVKKPLIVWRIKNPETLRKKMQLKRVQSVFSIDDVYGIRVLVNSISEAYAVLKKVTETFDGFIDHDYISKPQKGRLRLLQFVAYKNGVSFEIQITTIIFNKINESFHQKYHDKKYLQNP